jgi:RNA polymerase sigma-70 factor (ECF subfamily)
LSKIGQKPEPGRAQAFAQFSSHRPMLRAYLHAVMRDSELVDDTLSDVGVEIARSWDRYDQALPFGPWVRGLARRVALKRLSRRDRREVTLPDDVMESIGVAVDQLGDQAALEAQREQLRRCLERLSDRNRELVRLRYDDELSLELIARRVRRSIGALYTAYSRIHAALLRCMEGAEDRLG